MTLTEKQKKELKQAQTKLDARVAEIRGMTNKQLLWAICAEAGWQYVAERDMKRELAENTAKDLELLKYEALGRMRLEVENRAYPRTGVIKREHSIDVNGNCNLGCC